MKWYEPLLFPVVLLVDLLGKMVEYWYITAVVVVAILPWGIDQIHEDRMALNRGAHGAGVCSTLSEDAYVVALFVNDKESSWTSEEIQQFMDNCVDEGITFIKNWAVVYGQDLSLEYGYHLREDGTPKILSNSGVFYDEGLVWLNGNILKKAAKGLGYSSTKAMLNSDRAVSGEEQIAYIICVNKPGRSYAMRKRILFGYNSPEYVVVFSELSEGVKAYENVVAHELLHLFGAEDYYSEGIRRVSRERLAEILCPKDTMLCQSVGDFSVDKYTAYTIGWLDEMPAEYNQLGWWF